MQLAEDRRALESELIQRLDQLTVAIPTFKCCLDRLGESYLGELGTLALFGDEINAARPTSEQVQPRHQSRTL